LAIANRWAELLAERLPKFNALRDQGHSIRETAVILNLSASVASRYERYRKAAAAQAAVKSQTPPIRPVIPEGFELRKLSTTVDANGATKSQSFQAKPEGQPDDTVPEGHVVKGLSTLLDESGNVRAQWIKTRIDETQLAKVGEAVVEALRQQIEPISTITGPTHSLEHLATLYTLTDCHVGMLAWPKETQDAPWDTQIAERVLGDTFCRMIDLAPATAVGIVNQLGDFLHFDSLLAVTPTSGHILDSDSRYQLVVRAAVRILKRIVMHALTKHAFVHVWMNEGNHDMAGSVWLRVLFAELFANNPRVDVHTSPNPYQALQFGKTMLGFYHGHLAKKTSLPQIYAAQHSKMWGETAHRYVHCGHLHNVEEKEYPGIIVTQHPTIASPDAYAARYGYMSKRQATAITYHRELGEVARASYLPVE
jgi:hypothetical protein